MKLNRRGNFGRIIIGSEPVIGITKTKYGFAISRNNNVGGIIDDLICHDLGISVYTYNHQLKKFGGEESFMTMFFETEAQAMNALIWIKSEMVKGNRDE